MFSKLIDVDSHVIKEALDQAQKSLTVNPAMVKVAQDLKSANPEIQIYIMSNISKVRFLLA